MRQYFFQLNSNLIEAEKIKDKIREILFYYYDRNKLESFLFCFHELLNNAIEHGNKHSPTKQVFIYVTLKDQLIQVSIEDEGEGFNWKEKMQKELDIYSYAERGRGIIMTKMMCNELMYNDKGNRVTCIKSLLE